MTASEMEFKPSPPFTMGVELELQILNPRDYNLARDAADLIGLLEKNHHPGAIKPEITESMVEINSSIHRNHDSVLDELRLIRDAMVQAAERLNLRIAGGGSHPFHKWSERRIYPTERFKQILNIYGYLAKQFTIFGQHVHIGVPNGDEALYLAHMLSRYVPHFIALSASSPFQQGEDTSYQSSRLNTVSAFPLSGQLPFVHSWEEFTLYFNKMRGYGVVESMKDFYWDIRPKPEYGTIELRVCDTPLTVERAAALAAYLQTLCRHLLHRLEEPPAEDDYLVYTYNRFQACRFGLDGLLVHPKTREPISIREDILATLRRLAPHAQALESQAGLDEIERVAGRDGNHATYLRRSFGANGNVQAVVRAAVDALRLGPR